MAKKFIPKEEAYLVQVSAERGLANSYGELSRDCTTRPEDVDMLMISEFQN